MASRILELRRSLTARLRALIPHPEARDFSDLVSSPGYVEVAVNKGSLSL